MPCGYMAGTWYGRTWMVDIWDHIADHLREKDVGENGRKEFEDLFNLEGCGNDLSLNIFNF